MNQELWKKTVEKHGHECPGVALGFRIGEEVNKINEFLSALGVDVQVIGNVYLDVEALKKGIDVGKAIVVEGTGISILGEVENLIQKSIEYNIELLGSVVL